MIGGPGPRPPCLRPCTSTDNTIQDHFKSFRLKPGYVARRFGNKEGMCCKVLGISDSYPAKTFYIKRFQLLESDRVL